MSMRGTLHAPHVLSKKHLAALYHWLPVFGAEALLLAGFLSWIGYRGVLLHGNAVAYAWAVYGLIALGILFLWIRPDGGQRPGVHRSRGRG